MSERQAKLHIKRGIFGDISGALLFQAARLRKPDQYSLSLTPVRRETAAEIYAAKLDGRPEISLEIADAIHVVEGLNGQAASLYASAEGARGLYREIAQLQADARRVLAQDMIGYIATKYELTGDTERELSRRHAERPQA